METLAADSPGGSGIGALLAHELAQKGAQVVVLSITEPEYEPTSELSTYCRAEFRTD